MNGNGVSLSEQVECLQARVRDLEHILKLDLTAPRECGLTPTRLQMLGLLLSREIVSHDSFFTALYGHRADGGPGPNNIDVQIVHLRRRLRFYGIEVKNVKGRGYYIPPEMKARAHAFLRGGPLCEAAK